MKRSQPILLSLAAIIHLPGTLGFRSSTLWKRQILLTRGSRNSSFASNQSGLPDGTQDDDVSAARKRLRDSQLEAVVNPKKALVRKRKDGEAASASMDLPVQPLVKTIPGGANLIFEAARQSVPRWHPTTGFADINPNFRTQSPMMSSQGYASSIWKNARKRRQPAMWRYSVRTFDRMMEQRRQNAGPKLDITNLHYEGVLTATAKLGWSERALQIYKMVQQQEEKTRDRAPSPQTATNGNGGTKQSRKGVYVTENMVLSVIRACARESVRQKSREPLDTARKLAEEAERLHGTPVTAIYWNPIAASYQSLGLSHDANDVLLTNLADRVGGPEAENVLDNSFNVFDVQAKDKGSYSLLVSSAVAEQDWGGAVEALRTMTEAGLYPANRHLNKWTEISERNRGSVGSSKPKRPPTDPSG